MAMASAQCDDVQGVMMALGLEQYFVALRDEVGCVAPTDLDDLDREDLVTIKMNEEEIDRLLGRNNKTATSQIVTARTEEGVSKAAC